VLAALLSGGHPPGNLVVNGDFEAGNSGFAGAFRFGSANTPASYVIASDPKTVPGSGGGWQSFGDHTDRHGLMLIAKGGAAAPFWSETVRVRPHTTYRFSVFGASLNVAEANPATIRIKINGRAIGGGLALPRAGGSFVNATRTWNSGSATAAVLTLADENVALADNGFAVDDISFAVGTVPAPLELASWGCMLMGLLGSGAALRGERDGLRSFRAALRDLPITGSHLSERA
jgi:hypothetical protein